MSNQNAIQRLSEKIRTWKFKKRCYFIIWVFIIAVVIAVPVILIGNMMAVEAMQQDIKVMQRDTLDQIMELRQEVDTIKADKPPEPETAYYDIPLSDQQQDSAFEVCRQFHIEPRLLFAVMEKESGYRADLVSNGDYGIMQINVSSNKELRSWLGITDFLDYEQNILAGAYKLSCAISNTDTLDKALMVYHQGTAGAQQDWNAGIYKTKYSQAVLAIAYTIKEK